MTKLKAKELSLKVWRYLAKHPKITRKKDMPKSLYAKIEFLQGECPLCEAFFFESCLVKCPLKGCLSHSKVFILWKNAVTPDERKEAAQKIVSMIEAWEPEEEVTV